MAFVGVSHSYEAFYQSARRCWRFGQTREVHAHVITASTEGRVTERLPWLPWAGMAGAAAVLITLIAVTMKPKKGM